MGGSQEPHLYEYNYIYICLYIVRVSGWGQHYIVTNGICKPLYLAAM